MNDVFFISDLHFGHYGLNKFSHLAQSVDSHEEYIEMMVARWNSVVKKGDSVWVLGDAARNQMGLLAYKGMNGLKHLVRGNHDTMSTLAYLNFFHSIHGITKMYGYWISHCPIHPVELRGKKNIHGHVHGNIIEDKNYLNVCVEILDGYPINLKDIERNNTVNV